ncbi:MAG: hypothetical protein AAF266_15085 [Planctomycetota bacterium]
MYLNSLRRRLVLAAVLLLGGTPAALGQVFDSGPSDPSLFTGGVFNVPPDVAPSFLLELQQLNLAAVERSDKASSPGPAAK